jgi:hypothetical protein
MLSAPHSVATRFDTGVNPLIDLVSNPRDSSWPQTDGLGKLAVLDLVVNCRALEADLRHYLWQALQAATRCTGGGIRYVFHDDDSFVDGVSNFFS